ncbi:zf-HC2 domain-containing protein [Candidatus Uabimicrobium sp. HlEnr_7]|uniref:zf-HC2 domain-containing protein n=1 Tax=Candidatus Uabimicrobium helgolandensis TaxID=3095367 RepID=UPI00355907D9
MDCEQVKILLMAQEDGEITSSQQEKLHKQLENCSDCSCLQYWQSFAETEAEMQKIKFVEPQEQAWNIYWDGIYNRLERRLGFIFVSFGAVILIAYTMYELLKELMWNVETPALVRAGLAIFIIGMIILFVSVVRERLVLRKHDPFERINK